jgi:2-hydroxymuconate-semialdehyde hydrolase
MFPAPRQRWVDAMMSDESDIKNITHETLIILGREDEAIPMATSLKLFELIPNSQLHTFGKCGHWTQIEHTQRFNQLALNFFDES